MSTICHLGAWGENWGDRAIQYALQKAIGTEHEWRNFNIQEASDPGQAWQFGKPDLLLIGGGGLLWDKPELANASGWQWDISVEEIERLEMPVVVHSIGLTKFPYHDRTGRQLEYWETLEALVEKAELFSVRNDMTREHLTKHGLDGSKITVCPDPALFLGLPLLAVRHTIRDGQRPQREMPDGRPILGVCLAWDKMDWRWPGRYGGAAALTEFMDALSQTLIDFANDGWELRPFCHIPVDEEAMVICLDAAIAAKYNPGSMPNVWLPWGCNCTAGESDVPLLAQRYAECTAVVSMRKHGLLIPAGLGVPVVGLGDMREVKAICEQLGADCIRSEDATAEAFTEAILGATIPPVWELREAHNQHIAVIKDLLE